MLSAAVVIGALGVNWVQTRILSLLRKGYVSQGSKQVVTK